MGILSFLILVLEGFLDSFPKGFLKLGFTKLVDLSYLLNRAVKVY